MQESPRDADIWAWSALDEEEVEPEQAMARALQRLEIVARRQVNHLFAGDYHSSFRGRGMSFEDFRLYQPGDEVRWIDWNVSARMGDTYIKQFSEERERSVIILWDASPSMQWGTVWRSKRMLGAELAMLIALSAIKNNDRVGLIVFRDRVERYVAPQKGRKHVMRLIQEILRPPERDLQKTHSDVYAALQYLQHVERRHSIVFLLSDFLMPVDERLLQVASQRYELSAIQIIDPLEDALPQDSPTSHEEEAEESSKVSEGPGVLSWLLVMLWWLPAVLWGGGWWASAGVGTLMALWGAWRLKSQRMGLVWLRDLESGASRCTSLDLAGVRTQHHENAKAFFQGWEEACTRAQIDLLRLQTDQDILPALHRFFQQRRAIRKR